LTIGGEGLVEGGDVHVPLGLGDGLFLGEGAVGDSERAPEQDRSEHRQQS
jgi:hypothetical protein